MKDSDVSHYTIVDLFQLSVQFVFVVPVLSFSLCDINYASH